MRCTKCHYLSFEPEARCKNCGHDLSMDEAPVFDTAGAVQGHQSESKQAATAVLAPPRPAAALSTSRSSSAIATGELPLFMRSMPGGLGDDEYEEPEPLVKVPARPRVPVAVRRSTPDPARLRAKYGLPEAPEPDLLSNFLPDALDKASLHDDRMDLADLPLVASTTMPWPSEPTPERLPAAWQPPVSGGTRLTAAVIDAALLGSIAAAVVFCTLRLTGLSIQQVGLLPVLPMAALFLLLAGGYLLMFTAASGQTVGKMAMHIRVVGTSSEAVINDRITVAQAAVRALAALPSVLALGAGFVPALLGAGLAVHDRIAHTRVVRL